MLQLCRHVLLSVMLGVWSCVASGSESLAADPDRIDPKGLIVLMRHAEAPGVGDPPNFQLRDCSTQRNLDTAGREQARRIGERLRLIGIRDAAVYSSQWCRCLETARLLDVGSVQELPVLNSFFDRREERDAQIAALRLFLAGLPRDSAPVVLVTHQVVVTALTGVYPASGESVLLRANGTGEPAQLGRVPARPEAAP
ncbi:histidine phosphatase family protein [Azospirillum rugosum]|uniref:Broad specificity phosphatase PhoE n=1 Tax=Azospirillum rugosum TaxID=416170 RepID=A0ABS4STN4_9PROT|nr:histidine phosphatase family protein [Azospirillum rugosum]MBP2295797.1 broad specificity phosphatase PhoE [Azospirillum rugosum]MDQ0529092.1 broad specificity phosphatase PhoE [Azospirillum rugosum]